MLPAWLAGLVCSKAAGAHTAHTYCHCCPPSLLPAAPLTPPYPCRADAFYCFHQINAWEEEEGSLQLDLAGYDEGRAWVEEWELPHLRSGKAVVPASDIRRCAQAAILCVVVWLCGWRGWGSVGAGLVGRLEAGQGLAAWLARSGTVTEWLMVC